MRRISGIYCGFANPLHRVDYPVHPLTTTNLQISFEISKYLPIGIGIIPHSIYFYILKRGLAKQSIINMNTEEQRVNQIFEYARSWGLPYFPLGANVTLKFGDKGVVLDGKIIALHAYDEKHKYDVEVNFTITMEGMPVRDTVRLYNVDAKVIEFA